MSHISFAGARWDVPNIDEGQVVKLVQTYGLPEIIARLLTVRNVGLSGVDAFLRPKLSTHFPDPFHLKDMDKLATRVCDAIQKGEKIGILADFDVDGATSGSILTRALRHFGVEPVVYIPDRLKDGYGPSNRFMQKFKDEGCAVMLTLDCGITSHEPLAFATELGMDAIVVDHHEDDGKLPEIFAVVNPKRKDDISGYDMMAACGVTFLVAVAIQSEMRKRGACPADFPMKNLLELVALGTVCDMVPLTGPNRLFVKYGLPMMGQGNNVGVKALCNVSGIKGQPNLMHLGFALGPRINAGSRVHSSEFGFKLLSTEDEAEALNIAWLLNDCNSKRKDIEKMMLEQAFMQIETEGLADDPIIVLEHKDWHAGLSGLVAGRVKERTGKPCACVTYVTNGSDGTSEGRGSGRSVKGLNMASLFQAACKDNVLMKGGGHAMAAGFTISPDKVNEFREYAKAHALEHMEELDEHPLRLVDSMATTRSAQPAMVNLLENEFGPYGQGHAQPLFGITNVRIEKVDVLKDAHVRVNLVDISGGTRLKAMLFRGIGTPLGDTLVKMQGEIIDIVGKFVTNEWNGRVTAEMHIEDAGQAGMINAKNNLGDLAKAS